MYFIATNFPLGEIAGIYKEWIYSAGKIDGKLVIFRKKIKSLNEWEEFFDTDLILSKAVNCECVDGISAAFGVIGSSFVVIANGKLNNIDTTHKFCVNLDSTEVTHFLLMIETDDYKFQDLCNLCYQSNIFQYDSDSDWLIDSWKYKSSPHIDAESTFEYKQWWCSNIHFLYGAKKECFINGPTAIRRLTGNYRIVSNIGIIKICKTFIYFTDAKQLIIYENSKEVLATVSEDSDMKEWDDIGFWQFDGKLICLPLKKISETEFDISSYQVIVEEGKSVVRFVKKFSLFLHDICPDLHTSRFFVTSNVILFQNECGIVTVVDEDGFDPVTFGKKLEIPVKEADCSKIINAPKQEVIAAGTQNPPYPAVSDQVQGNKINNPLQNLPVLPRNPLEENAGNRAQDVQIDLFPQLSNTLRNLFQQPPIPNRLPLQYGIQTNYPPLPPLQQNVQKPAAKVTVKPPPLPKIKKVKVPATPKPRKESVKVKTPTLPKKTTVAASASKKELQKVLPKKATPLLKKRKAEEAFPKPAVTKLRKVTNPLMEFNSPPSKVQNTSATLATVLQNFKNSNPVMTPKPKKIDVMDFSSALFKFKAEPSLSRISIKKEPITTTQNFAATQSPSILKAVKTENPPFFVPPRRKLPAKVKQEVRDPNEVIVFDF